MVSKKEIAETWHICTYFKYESNIIEINFLNVFCQYNFIQLFEDYFKTTNIFPPVYSRIFSRHFSSISQNHFPINILTNKGQHCIGNAK